MCDCSKTTGVTRATGATRATRAYKATCANRADLGNTCFQFPWKKNIPRQDTLKKLNVRQQKQLAGSPGLNGLKELQGLQG